MLRLPEEIIDPIVRQLPLLDRWTLVQVCTMLRQICLGRSSLWTSVDFQAHCGAADCVVAARLSMTVCAFALKLSGNTQLLDIYISACSCSEGDHTDHEHYAYARLYRLLDNHRARLQRISFSGRHEACADFFHMFVAGAELSHLRVLVFEATGTRTDCRHCSSFLNDDDSYLGLPQLPVIYNLQIPPTCLSIGHIAKSVADAKRVSENDQPLEHLSFAFSTVSDLAYALKQLPGLRGLRIDASNMKVDEGSFIDMARALVNSPLRDLRISEIPAGVDLADLTAELRGPVVVVLHYNGPPDFRSLHSGSEWLQVRVLLDRLLRARICVSTRRQGSLRAVIGHLPSLDLVSDFLGPRFIASLELETHHVPTNGLTRHIIYQPISQHGQLGHLGKNFSTSSLQPIVAVSRKTSVDHVVSLMDRLWITNISEDIETALL